MVLNGQHVMMPTTCSIVAIEETTWQLGISLAVPIVAKLAWAEAAATAEAITGTEAVKKAEASELVLAEAINPLSATREPDVVELDGALPDIPTLKITPPLALEAEEAEPEIGTEAMRVPVAAEAEEVEPLSSSSPTNLGVERLAAAFKDPLRAMSAVAEPEVAEAASRPPDAPSTNLASPVVTEADGA
jgi:hypothetical protein